MSNLNAAREEANRWAKAQQMTAQGYTAYPDDKVQDLHIVNSPEGSIYLVAMFGSMPTCTCPNFQKRQKRCKHILWMSDEMRNAELVAEFEAMYGACENERTGCDAYARY